MDPAKQIDNLIQEHERRVEKLRTIQALLADDPELAAELRKLLGPPIRVASGKPRVELVLDYLKSKDNEWQTSRQIAEGAGLRRNTVNFLLFASKHKDLFESEMRGPKNKVWRIKDKGVISFPKDRVKKARKTGT